jgi:glycosyltransferase 2 family protein
MPQRLRSFFKYILIFGATVFLVWFSLRGLVVVGTSNTLSDKWNYLYTTWQKADKGWLFLMAGISMVSHLLRAERWRMLLRTSGNGTSLHHSFLSLMLGYLVNLVIPRGGEVSRCYNLYQLNKTPVQVSLGTVVVERLIDVFLLLTIVGLAFLLQTEKLLAFIESLALGQSTSNNSISTLILAGLIVIVVLAILFWLVGRNKKLKEKLLTLYVGFKAGLLSIKKLSNPTLFVIYSISIWVLYFIMSYTVMLAFSSTASLGIGAVLSVFALGSIAMAAPLPGGAGAYHALVPAGITFLYGINLSDAIAFVFVFHAWQTLIMIVAGALSIITSAFLAKK